MTMREAIEQNAPNAVECIELTQSVMIVVDAENATHVAVLDDHIITIYDMKGRRETCMYKD